MLFRDTTDMFASIFSQSIACIFVFLHCIFLKNKNVYFLRRAEFVFSDIAKLNY